MIQRHQKIMIRVMLGLALLCVFAVSLATLSEEKKEWEQQAKEVKKAPSEEEIMEEIAGSAKNRDEKGRIKELVEVAPGTSAVDTTSGKVVTQNGEEADNEVDPGSPEAPQQSAPLKRADIPNSSLELKMSETAIVPSKFAVSKGQVVSLTVTGADSEIHILKFKDNSLKAVALGIMPGESRSITFNAPDGAGEYMFYDEVADFKKKGARGIMVVE